MALAQQLVGLLAWLLVLAGCVLLHFRVRCRSSISLLLAISACAAWMFWGQSAFWQALPMAPGIGAARDLVSIGHAQSIAAAIETALMLWVGGSFFFAIKAIRPVARDAA